MNEGCLSSDSRNTRQTHSLAWCTRVSVCVGLACLALLAFQWSLYHALAFLMWYVLKAAILCFFAATFWAVFVLVKFRAHGWHAAQPLMVCIVTATLALTVPWTDLWLDVNIWRYREARQAVVREVTAGSLQPSERDRPSIISLGRRFPGVSEGGNEVVVETHENARYVLFYTFRGILDNYSGVLYVPPGGDPRRFSDLDEPTAQIRPLKANWYFVTHR